MIELRYDVLRFSFPRIQERLRGMVDAEIERRMPAWLAEDRAQVLRRLCETDGQYRNAGIEWQRRAGEKLVRLTADEIRRGARVHVERETPGCSGAVGFMRTLRVPDDNKTYPLPPDLGEFPLRHVDDFAQSVPETWLRRGGVMMPMYQSEALWLSFDAAYPFALKIATGKINAVSGTLWCQGLGRDPQDYVVVPDQPWLDGYCVGKGTIRQFVAMPLGDGYGAEEQITGKGEFGGIQLQAHPLKAERFFDEYLLALVPDCLGDFMDKIVEPPESRNGVFGAPVRFPEYSMCVKSPLMSLAAGGRMRQEIYEDERGAEAWDEEATSRCFVHLCNSLVWRQITGENAPHPPFTAEEYNEHGLPWFDWYDDAKAAMKGAAPLKGLKTIVQMGQAKGANPLPENASVDPQLIVQYGEKRRPEQVREWAEET